MQQIGFLLQNLLSVQHVSGTIMPIIRSSGIIQMVAARVTSLFGLPVVGLVWSSRFLCVRVARYCYAVSLNQDTPDQRPVNQRAM